jgi:Ca2+-binding RTX toxin-like protein
MDVSILANLFLFLGALGVNLALDASGGSDTADNDPLYDATNYTDTREGTGDDDDITTVGESEAWFLAAGDDRFAGSSGNDYVSAGTGNDTAETGAGSDIALGGAGNDSLAGGSGGDSLFGGADDDSLWGNAGDDSLAGDDGDDWLTGGSGADTLSGGAGNDFLSGFTGDDSGAPGMTTPEGIDQLLGGVGNDTLLMGHGDGALGGAGNDSFILDHRFSESTGQFRLVDFNRAEDQLQLHYLPRYASDTNEELLPELRIELSPDGESSLIRMNGSVIAQLDGVTDLTLADIELVADTSIDTSYIRGDYDAEVVQGDGNDTASGAADPTAWFTAAGDDALTGSAGDDYANLGSGHDQAALAAGDDSVRADAGNDSVGGGHGNDTLWGGLGDDSLTGDAGNDRILGDQGADVLTGGAGADSVVGGAGDDTVSGYTRLAAGEDGLTAIDGIDILSGGAGNDTLIVGRGDIALGGTGNDAFEIDNRWLESTQVAVINDYVTGEDQLEIHYTPAFGSDTLEVPPVLTIVAGPGNAYSILRINGEPVANIMSSIAIALSEVTLVRDT